MEEVVAVKYETVAQCDICASPRNRLIDEKGHIVQCKGCGLKFVSPRPTQESIAEIYDWCRQNYAQWGQVTPQKELLHEKRFAFLDKFIRRGKILDVGAGLGHFLLRAKNTQRWQCFGTETSQYAVDFAKKEFGLELALGQLEDLPYPDGFFDAVTFWHVLEHLPYPSKAIQESSRFLKAGGWLFIAVPNDSWLGRPHFFKNAFKQLINRLPIKQKLRLKKMYPEIEAKGNVHLFYFTPASLRRLLARYGFRIKRYSVDYDYGQSSPRLERKYRWDLWFCHLNGINLGNAILLAAQKVK